MARRSRLWGHGRTAAGCQCGERPDPPVTTRTALGRWYSAHIIDLRMAAAEQRERADRRAELALYRKATN